MQEQYSGYYDDDDDPYTSGIHSVQIHTAVSV